MTNPTDIPTNWQGGAEGMAQPAEELDLNQLSAEIEQNLDELKGALESGDIDQETYDQLAEILNTMKTQVDSGEAPSMPFNTDEPIPALIGMLAAGMVSLFTPMGASMWTVDEPERLAELIGRGVLPRSIQPGSGMREIGNLNLPKAELVVAERVGDGTETSEIDNKWEGNENVSAPTVGEAMADGTSVLVRYHTFHLSEPADTEENPWLDVEALLRRLAAETPERGEYVVLEKATDLDQMDESKPHPDHYVLFGVFPAPGGEEGDNAVIETYPHPEGVQFWDQVDKPAQGPTIVAAAANTDTADQGSIATVAAASWEGNPWDLILSYAPVPPRPGTPEAEAWEKAMAEAQAEAQAEAEAAPAGDAAGDAAGEDA